MFSDYPYTTQEPCTSATVNSYLLVLASPKAIRIPTNVLSKFEQKIITSTEYMTSLEKYFAGLSSGTFISAGPSNLPQYPFYSRSSSNYLFSPNDPSSTAYLSPPDSVPALTHSGSFQSSDDISTPNDHFYRAFKNEEFINEEDQSFQSPTSTGSLNGEELKFITGGRKSKYDTIFHCREEVATPRHKGPASAERRKAQNCVAQKRLRLRKTNYLQSLQERASIREEVLTNLKS